MNKPEFRFFGMIEVDSGTLLIGDPGYVLPRAIGGKPGVDYEEVVHADDSEHATCLAGQPVLLLQRFGGDGTFPVFGEFQDASSSACASTSIRRWTTTSRRGEDLSGECHCKARSRLRY